jgi:hypothetical protein
MKNKKLVIPLFFVFLCDAFAGGGKHSNSSSSSSENNKISEADFLKQLNDNNSEESDNLISTNTFVILTQSLYHVIVDKLCKTSLQSQKAQQKRLKTFLSTIKFHLPYYDLRFFSRDYKEDEVAAAADLFQTIKNNLSYYPDLYSEIPEQSISFSDDQLTQIQENAETFSNFMKRQSSTPFPLRFSASISHAKSADTVEEIAQAFCLSELKCSDFSFSDGDFDMRNTRFWEKIFAHIQKVSLPYQRITETERDFISLFIASNAQKLKQIKFVPSLDKEGESFFLDLLSTQQLELLDPIGYEQVTHKSSADKIALEKTVFSKTTFFSHNPIPPLHIKALAEPINDQKNKKKSVKSQEEEIVSIHAYFKNLLPLAKFIQQLVELQKNSSTLASTLKEKIILPQFQLVKKKEESRIQDNLKKGKAYISFCREHTLKSFKKNEYHGNIQSLQHVMDDYILSNHDELHSIFALEVFNHDFHLFLLPKIDRIILNKKIHAEFLDHEEILNTFFSLWSKLNNAINNTSNWDIQDLKESILSAKKNFDFCKKNIYSNNETTVDANVRFHFLFLNPSNYHEVDTTLLTKDLLEKILSVVSHKKPPVLLKDKFISTLVQKHWELLKTIYLERYPEKKQAALYAYIEQFLRTDFFDMSSLSLNSNLQSAVQDLKRDWFRAINQEKKCMKEQNLNQAIDFSKVDEFDYRTPPKKEVLIQEIAEKNKELDEIKKEFCVKTKDCIMKFFETIFWFQYRLNYICKEIEKERSNYIVFNNIMTGFRSDEVDLKYHIRKISEIPGEIKKREKAENIISQYLKFWDWENYNTFYNQIKTDPSLSNISEIDPTLQRIQEKSHKIQSIEKSLDFIFTRLKEVENSLLQTGLNQSGFLKMQFDCLMDFARHLDPLKAPHYLRSKIVFNNQQVKKIVRHQEDMDKLKKNPLTIEALRTETVEFMNSVSKNEVVVFTPPPEDKDLPFEITFLKKADPEMAPYYYHMLALERKPLFINHDIENLCKEMFMPLLYSSQSNEDNFEYFKSTLFSEIKTGFLAKNIFNKGIEMMDLFVYLSKNTKKSETPPPFSLSILKTMTEATARKHHTFGLAVFKEKVFSNSHKYFRQNIPEWLTKECSRTTVKLCLKEVSKQLQTIEEKEEKLRIEKESTKFLQKMLNARSFF